MLITHYYDLLQLIIIRNFPVDQKPYKTCVERTITNSTNRLLAWRQGCIFQVASSKWTQKAFCFHVWQVLVAKGNNLCILYIKIMGLTHLSIEGRLPLLPCSFLDKFDYISLFSSARRFFSYTLTSKFYKNCGSHPWIFVNLTWQCKIKNKSDHIVLLV